MNEIEAYGFVPVINEAIKHSPQQCVEPVPIVGCTAALVPADAVPRPRADRFAMVWIVTQKGAWRFLFKPDVTYPWPRLQAVQWIDPARAGELSAPLSEHSVPGNVRDRATTLAFGPLGLPEKFFPWHN